MLSVHCVAVLFTETSLSFFLQSLDAPSLQNISLTLNSNQLLAVIGPVGAGKVSYLHTSSFQSNSN